MPGEAPRNNALREIDRHRSTCAAAVRQTLDEIEDAEFRDVEKAAKSPQGRFRDLVLRASPVGELNQRKGKHRPEDESWKSKLREECAATWLGYSDLERSGADSKAETIAQTIAGPNASAVSLEKARRIGEAQVELNRVRARRNEALAAILSKPYKPTITVRQVRLISRFLDRVERGTVGQIDLETVDQVLHPKPPGSDEAVVMDLAHGASELARLDRYERRALSKRKLAIREFDALNLSQ